MTIKNSIILVILTMQITTYGQSNDCRVGDSLMVQQNYMMAITKYTSCYFADTLDKKPLSSVANCYMQLGDYMLAKQYFHALEKDSFYKTEAISKLAIIYESQQNLPKAIKYYLALQQIYHANPVYLRKLGNLYLQGREPKQALESYLQAFHFNPRDLLTIQGLTEFYLAADDLVMADSFASNGISIDSNNVGLQLLKSRIKYRERDYKTTSSILYKLTFQTELNNFYNKLLGYSFLQIDSLDKAIYHLQKSLLNEDNPEYALFYLALAYEKKKDYESSDYYYGEAIKEGISENMAQYHRGLARTHTIRGNYAIVLEQYKKSQEYQKEADVYYYMANAAEQYYKDKSVAIKYYQQYLDTNPQNDTWVNIAKDRIKALKEFRFMSKK